MLPGGGPPTGAASGDLSGSYPGPTIANNAITSAKIADGTIANADINAAAAIDATKLGNGTVDNTELGYLDGVTSAIQTQFAAKANDADVVHDTGNESVGGIKNFTSQLLASGRYSSGGAEYPSLIFDPSKLKTGISGDSTGQNVNFYAENEYGIAFPLFTSSYQGCTFAAPLTALYGLNIGVYLHTGDVGTTYVMSSLRAPSTIACFPTYAGVPLDVVLPDPFIYAGGVVVVSDEDNGAAANNITLTCIDDVALGCTVEGGASYTISTNGKSVILRATYNADFTSANWKVIASN